jgi:hypothetical protein
MHIPTAFYSLLHNVVTKGYQCYSLSFGLTSMSSTDLINTLSIVAGLSPCSKVYEAAMAKMFPRLLYIAQIDQIMLCGKTALQSRQEELT